MAYIGNNPDSILQGRNAVYTITATAGQTAFSGTDDNGNTIDLLQAESNNVFLNGSRLVDTTDFTLNGDVLTLTVAAAVNDIMVITTAQEMGHASSYTKAAADSRYINYDGDVVNGTIQMGGGPGNNITFADNNKIVMGTGNDLEIYHNATNSIIQTTNTHSFKLMGGSNNYIVATPANAVTLYHNGSPKIATSSTGIDVTGNVVVSGTVDGVGGAMTGNVTFADSNEIVMGAGSDLRVYHHPTSGNKIVGSGTYGNIVIQSHQTEIIDNGGIVVADFSADSSSARLHWASSASFGGGVKLATTSTGVDITNIDLTAIDTDISDTAVDVFIYDTRKDSDGGAWRKRTQHTSWYNETLNTATRGSRKEFPAVAVIVAESTQVTIYDGDDPDMPMWMVFNTVSGDYSHITYDTRPLSSISVYNGVIAVGSNHSTGHLNRIKLIEDATYNHTSSSFKLTTNIADRNIGADALVYGNTPLVNRTVNDIAMTVLPNSPINSATGLPVPTIAVATDGGVSVIKDDGSVVDITQSTIYNNVYSIDFTHDNKIIYTMDNATSRSARVDSIPNVDFVVTSNQLSKGSGEEFYTGADFGYSNGDLNIILPSAYSITEVVGSSPNCREIATTNGMTKIALSNQSDPSSGLAAHIASDYNTGWMPGDIRLATCVATGTGTYAAGSNLDDRCFHNETVTATGSGFSYSPVATGADLSYVGGMSAGTYAMTANAAVDIDWSSDWYITFWCGNQAVVSIELDTGSTSAYNNTTLALWCSNGSLLTRGASSGLDVTHWTGDCAGKMITAAYVGGVMNIYVDGYLENSVATPIANANRSIVIGRRSYNNGSYGTLTNQKVALLRVGSGTLPAEQIAKIYNDEKFLFQENAKATLYGSSDAVTALAYDDDTELLHAGTSGGRSVFQGLRRIDNTTDAVGAAISASNGMVAED